MSTYKAIRIEQTGDVQVLNYTNLPKSTPGPNEILVKNEFIGLNFIDLYHRAGIFPLPLPATLGVEASGSVEAIGSGVQDISVGDRVAFYGASSYSEYSVVPRGQLTKLPESISSKTAATILLQGLTALTMVQGSYNVKKGDIVLIHAAAGGTGQQLVKLANHLGATVIGTTSSAEKAEIARKVGAHHVINYKEEDVVKKVQELTDGQGVHAVFDGVGKSTFDISLASLRRLGTVITFGSASGPVEPVDVFKLAAKNIRLMSTSLFGFFGSQQEFEHWVAELFNLYEQGAVPEEVYKVYTLSEAKQAHLDLESRKSSGKLLLTP